MDATTRRLVDFAMQARFSALPERVVHEAKRRLVDTVACAIGAWNEPLSRTARAFAARSTGAPAASIWGCAEPVGIEAAAFANGVMLRYLDLSDMYRVKSGGHPSDVIAAVLAAGEAVGASGADTLSAIVLAYDVYCSFCEAIDINSMGWDQPVYGVLASAIGAGKLLGLPPAQMGDAIALALAPNMALINTRRGELSSWKGCAAANASRNGVFAALLARDGFTGPTAVFEGKHGMWDIVGRFDWLMPSEHLVARTHIKCFPVCYHGQSAAWAALDLRPRVAIADIAGIRVQVYHKAFEEMASDPTRWAPRTHETADHSLPYVVSSALLDGEITADSFSDAKLADPARAALMQKVQVEESEEFSAQYPESAPCRIVVSTHAGQSVEAYVRYPKGHDRSPLDDAELDHKFQSLFRGFGDTGHGVELLDALRGFERCSNVRELTGHMVRRA